MTPWSSPALSGVGSAVRTTAPSPKASWARCSPIRNRTWNPNAAHNQSVASTTSWTASVGMTVAGGIERLTFTARPRGWSFVAWCQRRTDATLARMHIDAAVPAHVPVAERAPDRDFTASVPDLEAAPKDVGRLEAIVVRPTVETRQT